MNVEWPPKKENTDTKPYFKRKFLKWQKEIETKMKNFKKEMAANVPRISIVEPRQRGRQIIA